MKTSGRLGLIMVLALAAALTGGGAVTAYQELNVFAAGGIGPASRFAALLDDAYRPGPSLLSKRLLLDTCREAIEGLHGRLRPQAERQAMLGECLGQADAIVATAPSFSYGWYVGALAAVQLDDDDGFNARLRRSQITGPAEQWVAELRAGLVEEHWGEVSPEVRAGHLEDLRLLVASRRGIAAISGRYLRAPEFRERITVIVETMPEADQARFVATVRRSAAAAASP